MPPSAVRNEPRHTTPDHRHGMALPGLRPVTARSCVIVAATSDAERKFAVLDRFQADHTIFPGAPSDRYGQFNSATDAHKQTQRSQTNTIRPRSTCCAHCTHLPRLFPGELLPDNKHGNETVRHLGVKVSPLGKFSPGMASIRQFITSARMRSWVQSLL